MQHNRVQLSIGTIFLTRGTVYKSENTKPTKERHTSEGKIAQTVKQFTQP
jgi:hypothetical protein